MTSRKLMVFLDPPPLIVTHSRNLSVLFVTLWVTHPPERDIIYGWSLTETHAS